MEIVPDQPGRLLWWNDWLCGR